MSRLGSAWIVAVLLLCVAAGPLAAQEIGWDGNIDLSYTQTEGNAQSSNLAFNLDLARTWLRSYFWFNANAVLAEGKATGDRIAVGNPNNPTIVEPPTETTAERYLLGLGYDYRITERWFWGISGNGEQNRPSGLDQLLTGATGFGLTWDNRRGTDIRSGLWATYTSKDEVEPRDDTGETKAEFAGVRFTFDLNSAFGDSQQHNFFFNLVADQALEDSNPGAETSEGLIARGIVGVTAHLVGRLGLKFSVDATYNDDPPSEELPFFVGDTEVGTVPVQLDDLDWIVFAGLTVDISPGRKGTKVE